MIRTILVTHGRLALALLESAKMIFGDIPAEVRGVCLGPDDNLDSIRGKIEAALGTRGGLESAPPALALVDLFGGAPCNATAWVLQGAGSEIVAGVNLPMLLEVLLHYGELPVSELARLAVKAGAGGVVDVKAALADSPAVPTVEP